MKMLVIDFENTFLLKQTSYFWWLLFTNKKFMGNQRKLSGPKIADEFDIKSALMCGGVKCHVKSGSLNLSRMHWNSSQWHLKQV